MANILIAMIEIGSTTTGERRRWKIRASKCGHSLYYNRQAFDREFIVVMEEDASTSAAFVDEDTDASEFTCAYLDLDMTDNGYSFCSSDEEEDNSELYNAFFSAVPEAARANAEILREVNQTRDRKWTAYDLTSANFLPVCLFSYFFPFLFGL